MSRFRYSEKFERLLPREPKHYDMDEARRMVQGKVVLVTGGGGSIGSEICLQAAKMGASNVVIAGHGENSVFETQQNLAFMGYGRTAAEVVDTRDEQGVAGLFERHKPKVVLHAAGHKHVPLMEGNVREAVKNNVFGTKNVLEASVRWEVERFVFVSTDKAVNPTSVMGATKRVAELMVQAAEAEAEGRRSGSGESGVYVSVRFGNVLGSRGSVLLTWLKQLELGLPITVTHPDMTRYFMLVREAVELVLNAGAMGKGGEVFMLDMGHPVSLLDMARRLLDIMSRRDAEIVLSGIRPGEKLREELYNVGEQYRPERIKGINVLVEQKRKEEKDWLELWEEVESLNVGCAAMSEDSLRGTLKRIVPEYHDEMQEVRENG